MSRQYSRTSTTSISSTSHSFLFVFSASLEIAYKVMAVDKAKNPINMNAMDAKAIFVTMRCSAA